MIFRKHCSNVAVLKAVYGVSSAPHPHPCMFKSSGDSKVACPPSVPYIYSEDDKVMECIMFSLLEKYHSPVQQKEPFVLNLTLFSR